MTERSRYSITDGASQSTRFPDPLREGFILVDEMTAEDLLAFIADFSSSLHFFNLQHEPDGTWGDLLVDDEIVVMAQIASVDLRRLELECHRRFTSSPMDLALCAGYLAQTIDSWMKRLKVGGHEVGQVLHWKIAEVIEQRLSAELHGLGEWVTLTGRRDGFPIDFAAFDKVWNIHVGQSGCVFPKSCLPQVGVVDHEKRFLQSVLHKFVHGVSYLKTIVPDYLRRSMRSQVHRPAVSLLIAFVTLFRHAQAALNTFTERHLNFYYDQVLKVSSRPLVPDQAFLLLEKEERGPDLVIKKGTPFAAGKDVEQKERIYLADHDLVVTDAKVRSCCILSLERDPLISPEHELHYVTRAKAGVVSMDAPASEHSSEGTWPLVGAEAGARGCVTMSDAEFGFAIASPMLLLREGTRKIRLDLHMTDPADVDDTVVSTLKKIHDQDVSPEEGLCRIFTRFLDLQRNAVAGWNHHSLERLATRLIAALSLEQIEELVHLDSPSDWYNRFLLHLLHHVGTEEGFFDAFGRIIGRQLLFQPFWLSDEDKRMIADRAERRTSGISVTVVKQLLDRDGIALFYDVLRNAFIVDLTTPHGWYRVPDVVVEPSLNEKTGLRQGLRYQCVLGPDVDPIGPYRADVHGPRLKTRQPVIRFRVNPQAHVYGYSIFAGLILRRLVIDTAVEGLTSIVAYNNHGRLDPTKPFNPFGVLPSSHSYLIFGNYEMAQKPLVSVAANIEWGELPRDPEGFRGHYRGYDFPMANERVVVETSVLRDGQWVPDRKEQRARQPLFRSELNGDRLDHTSTLVIEAKPYFRPLSPDTTEEAFAAATHIRNGYFKISLAEPVSAFGHAAYPFLLSKVLSENAKFKKPRPVPNPPYTPLVTRFTVQYTARTTLPISFDSSTETQGIREQVFHLHPFGVERIYPVDRSAAFPLLPHYREEGQLFIGIQATQLGGLLSVFFSLASGSIEDRSPETSRITWWYLVGNTWRKLEPSRVLSDTTEGFLTSGAVTLDIPSDIDRTSTILQEKLFWLKVSARTHLRSFGAVRLIQTHGIRVTWQNQDNALSHLKRSLPPGTIRQALVPIPGLRQVTQIGESFGGRLPETPHQLRTRLSERLRHKHRASTPWDYERLILDHFPHVHKVKCFPTLSTGREGARPGSVLIVVVPKVTDQARNTVFTPMLTVRELARIQDTVRALASPFVRIEVRNPVYEWIQVRCAVKLADGVQRGILLNRLNEAIFDYVSPWREGGYQARFGWRIRREDLETVLRRFAEVEWVTKFSLLHITRDRQGSFSLMDTARLSRERRPAATSVHVESEEVTPIYPWSLAVPMPRHVIEPIDDLVSLQPESVGIGDLEIGRTFII